jgi:hypothetical protein
MLTYVDFVSSQKVALLASGAAYAFTSTPPPAVLLELRAALPACVIYCLQEVPIQTLRDALQLQRVQGIALPMPCAYETNSRSAPYSCTTIRREICSAATVEKCGLEEASDMAACSRIMCGLPVLSNTQTAWKDNGFATSLVSIKKPCRHSHRTSICCQPPTALSCTLPGHLS